MLFRNKSAAELVLAIVKLGRANATRCLLVKPAHRPRVPSTVAGEANAFTSSLTSLVSTSIDIIATAAVASLVSFARMSIVLKVLMILSLVMSASGLVMVSVTKLTVDAIASLVFKVPVAMKPESYWTLTPDRWIILMVISASASSEVGLKDVVGTSASHGQRRFTQQLLRSRLRTSEGRIDAVRSRCTSLYSIAKDCTTSMWC